MPKRAGEFYQNSVEPNIAVIKLGVLFQKRFGAGSDSPFLRVADGIGGIFERGTLFHFNKDQNVSPFGNKIDFARMCSAPANKIGRQNPIAF